MSALEYRRDFAGDRLYASRNHGDLSHTISASGANRSQVDWNLTLRQVRKKADTIDRPASLPNLLTAEREDRRGEPLAPEHADGPYHSNTATMGRYQNVGANAHMLKGLTRVSSGNSLTLDWHLNLRDGYHQKPDVQWRRYYGRPQQSFDMIQENCAKDNEAYQKSHITPQDRRPDRRSGAISAATIRDDPISFRRWSGCEGTNVGQWRHLLEDRRHGHKARRQIQQETTLREDKKDDTGAKISDNRSDGCLVEMLGKKKWVGHVSHNPLAARPPKGDPQLYHLSRLRILPEADEEVRKLRRSKHPRTDANIPDTHQGKGATES